MKRAKNNLNKLMEERNLTLADLDKICDVHINTLRKIRNQPYYLFCLDTAVQIVTALECSILDLIEEENLPAISYENLFYKTKSDLLYLNHQLFNSQNIDLLTDLFREVGIECSFTVYGDDCKVNIYNKHDFSPIIIGLNLLVEIQQEQPVLLVRNFDVCCNKKIYDEDVIIKLLLQQLETYAQKLKLKQMDVYTVLDFKPHLDTFRYKFSHIETDFTRTIGMSSNIFLELLYNPKRDFSSSYRSKYITWGKIL